ncbi:MAG: response regulator [bacterium]|nr:response regulator [bacterium]MBU1918530.1 response regulator [bacterium]
MTKRKVLIVDDELDLSEVTSFRLEVQGYEVRQAYNGHEGVEMAKTYQPDLILMDVLMPVMDGYEASKMLKRDEATRNIPVIAFTAANETMIGRKTIQRADDVVLKPFNIEDLLSKISVLIQ